MKETIKNIYFHYLEGNQYGLNVLFEFDNNYLLFDSTSFLILDKLNLPLFDWITINYNEIERGISITEIKEDENVSYFIKFSNNDIFYIYQKIYNLNNWEQDFEIINKHNHLKYNEISEYMNENWIESINV